jgi:uncharacterized protein YeeX (DUF496 family)
MPFYTFKSNNNKKLVQSLRQLINLTGMSERNLHRIFKNTNEYHEKSGTYIIEKWELEKDGRKNNTNPNMN